MNNLKNQLLVLMTLMMIAAGSTTYLSYQPLIKYFALQDQLELGRQAIHLAEEAIQQKHRPQTFKELQNYRQDLDGESRKTAMSEFIQAYDEKNKFLSKKRLSFFRKNEENYKKFVAQQSPYFLKVFKFYTIITLALALFFVFGLFIFIYRSFLKPIKDLNKKMMDFLNEKYTYQFLVPKNNEVGHLQATFNSLAQQVLISIEDLKELDKAKSEFLSIASHELRTPLTSIKGSLSLLQQGIVGQLPVEAESLMQIANEETERLIRLINDILDLTKIEARMLSLKEDWHSLDLLVNKTFESLSGLSHAAKVNLVYHKEAPYLIHMDIDRIQQVLTNLLSNAIKYSPSQGKVTFSVKRADNGHLIMYIKDQGPGISPQDQDLIFQQFRQVTNEQNPLVKGTGLGLAIAKALVEQHKGQIGVESIPGRGSTFHFTLPQWKLDMSDSQIRQRIKEAS